jgi:AcrR family transcriptional regulator
MDSLLKKLNIEFNDAKKPQSLQTLNDLIEAAEKIVEEGDVGQFAARSLAKESGYSLGSLINRLGKIENIFLYAISKERSRHIRAVCEAIEQLDPDVTVDELVEKFVDEGFAVINKVGPRILRYYEKRAALRAENISDIFLYAEETIPYMNRILAKNRSNTFRPLSESDKRYVARAIFLFLERPFVEGDPIAGTPVHRAMAINAIVGMLKA